MRNVPKLVTGTNWREKLEDLVKGMSEHLPHLMPLNYSEHHRATCTVITKGFSLRVQS